MDDKVTEIFIWKEISFAIDQEIKNTKGNLLLIHKSLDFPSLLYFFFKNFEDQSKLYLSLLRSSDYILENINDQGYKTENMFLIDCVSSFLNKKAKPEKNLSHEDPPMYISELISLLEKYSREARDIVIIDSLSKFVDFSSSYRGNSNEFYKLIHFIRENMFLSKSNIIFLYDEKQTHIRHIPKTHFNKILKIEAIEEGVSLR
ncbi:hypothetical protein GF327_03560 [Candidatus Woesearchaeota archaeon]|nr:hypothetical protein [Candidatus Woesearchaeota archaeon]